MQFRADSSRYVTSQAEQILCAPATVYTAMAATMYAIRATLEPPEYALFESLTTTGVSVLKHR